MKDYVAELTWRGMIHDLMPGTQEQLNKELTSGYIGFDPTADSLHIGNFVPIMLLVHFQRCGHKPIALVGGATGMVGDPSGKISERQLLTLDQIRHNLECQRKQLEKFLDFNCGANSAEIVNNYDWFCNFNLLDFIRDIGKHITINYMMAKDSVKSRFENGMSFTEFTYQLIQGYDFLWLYENKGCKLQMGGSDQWGNIVTGTELIRRKSGGEAYALTSPLVRKADGSKFGKSEGGNVWLDPAKTSPYKFYQYWLNASDEDIVNYLKIFTLFEEEKILKLKEEHQKAPHLRIMQKALAEDMTKKVHSPQDYEVALKASSILFGNATVDELNEIDEKTLLEIFDGVPSVKISKGSYAEAADVSALLSVSVNCEIFASKGEAKRMIAGGGVQVNKLKINDPMVKPDFKLLNNKYLLIQKGKKNYHLVIVE
jgi:tyrosyl-tRNA synthetase